MASPESKKCSNCTRAPQPMEEFINERGRECATCAKCRAKGKKSDTKPERREYHNDIQRENRYDVTWRAKQLEERPEEYRKHNNDVSSTWRAENPGHIARWNRTNVNHRATALKRAAATRGIEWHLTDDEAKAMLVLPCVYCGHLDIETRVNGIDRLDSSKGYTTENCRPCCKNCNYMKGTFDPRTFIAWAKRIATCTAEFPDVPTCEDHKKIHRAPKTAPEIQTTQAPSPYPPTL